MTESAKNKTSPKASLWNLNTAFAILVIVAMTGAIYLSLGDISLFKADVAVVNTNICAFTQPGGYIEQGTWRNQLSGLSSTTSGPEDQYGILGYELICNTAGGCLANTESYPATQSWVKENATLPYSTNTIQLALLAVNDTSLFTPTATVNGNVQILNGIRRGVVDGSGQPTGSIMTLNTPYTATPNSTNLTLYVRRNQNSSSNACAIAVFKINTGYTATIQGTVTDPAGSVSGIDVVLEPCPTNTANRSVMPGATTQSCTKTTNANGAYSFPNILPSLEPYSVTAVRDLP